MKTNTHKPGYYIINGITLYRIVAAPFLLILVFTNQQDIFKWLLGVSFFTDLIDGYLARKYKVTSIMGSRLDSIGDDLTVLVALVGLIAWKQDFLKGQIVLLSILFAFFLIQTLYALFRYGKISSFHTYLAKTAALLQGLFLLAVFFTNQPCLPLFYTAVFITLLELAEEIVLVALLPRWEANVKGIFWILQRGKKTGQP
jgi:phosphatidylglycerophosphate synthase